MKVYFSAAEGEHWQCVEMGRKEINFTLQFLRVAPKDSPFAISALRIGKSPFIYDFTLLRLGYTNWIRLKPAFINEISARIDLEL